MTLFISYSSRDHAALEKVRAALKRAHLQVWLDEELSGGEAWWNTILEQIRGCEVFIAALSKNYLGSKPCQAELRYAQDLHRPILPVQIGPLDSMRVNPLAAVQAIDYQNPSIDTGIELVAAVHAREAKVEPLPSPLPDPPPVPFAYLLRLDTAIAAPELGAREQAQLLSELKRGLETDGDEPSARRDLTQLLIKLRERPDITWKTRTDVDNVLTSIQTKTEEEPSRSSASAVNSGPPRSFGSGPPPPSFSSVPPASSSVGSGAPPSFPPGPPTGPQPMPMPPFGSPNTGAAHPRMSSKRWIIAGGAVAAVAAAVAVIFLIIPSPPPPPPTITAGQLNSILLTADEINTMMGASHMQASDVAQDMNNMTDTASDPSCIGALNTAQTSVYAGSGWSGVRAQTLVQHVPGQNTDVGHFFVNQAAVVFPTADQAHAFLKTSANNWKGCAGQTVTDTSGNRQLRWSFGDVTGADPKIVQLATQEAGGGWACQHALSVASNVVVEVQACSLQIDDQASQIANKMVAKTPH